ncbi:hypothetical protein BJ138DRAFT_1231957 [Hygrophoropsis aurantiaca]|uniref:Uncharacterized protein n=1 Tax=Hygrophoropsis aurantiaca TaxID=72124 RepID=A0ACB7ZVA0_9AGAM|nr:hypothetical protein BJ138DRAFT_1231957 [Hygrophoropsis aurantiaca]
MTSLIQNPTIQSYLDQIMLVISSHEACVQIDDKVAIPVRYCASVASQFSDQNPELAADVLSKSLDEFSSNVAPPPQFGVIDPENFLLLCVRILRCRKAGTISDVDHGTEVADRENREDVIQTDDGEDKVFDTGRTRALEDITQLRTTCDEITEKPRWPQLVQEEFQLKTDRVSHTLHDLGRDLSAQDKAHTSLAESINNDMNELKQEQKYIHKKQEALARRQFTQENNIIATERAEDAIKQLSSTVDDHKASAIILRGLFRAAESYIVRQQLWNDSLQKQLAKLQGTVNAIQRYQLSLVDSFSDVRTDIQSIRTRLGELEGSRDHNGVDLASVKPTLDVVVEGITDIRASLSEAVATLQTPVLTLTLADEFRRDEVQSGVTIAQVLSKLTSIFLAFIRCLSFLKLHLGGHRLNHIWAVVDTVIQGRLHKLHLRDHRRNRMIHMWAAYLQICVQGYRMSTAELSVYLALLGGTISRPSRRSLSFILATLITFCCLATLLHGGQAKPDQVTRRRIWETPRLEEGYHIVYE